MLTLTILSARLVFPPACSAPSPLPTALAARQGWSSIKATAVQLVPWGPTSTMDSASAVLFLVLVAPIQAPVHSAWEGIYSTIV